MKKMEMYKHTTLENTSELAVLNQKLISLLNRLQEEIAIVVSQNKDTILSYHIESLSSTSKKIIKAKLNFSHPIVTLLDNPHKENLSFFNDTLQKMLIDISDKKEF